MEGVVTNNVGILGFFCPKQGQAFRPPAAPLYPNMDQVPPPPPPPPPMLLSLTSKISIFVGSIPSIALLFS